jgi:hypothetical protein
MASGFTTAMMAFDADMKPANWKKVPEFYGYIPDDASLRVLIFVELFAVHNAHAMLKTLTIATLLQTNWRWLVAYIAAIIACSFCTKLHVPTWCTGFQARCQQPQRTAIHRDACHATYNVKRAMQDAAGCAHTPGGTFCLCCTRSRGSDLLALSLWREGVP